MPRDRVDDLLAKLKAFEAAHPVQRGPKCAACSLPPEARAFIGKARAKGSTCRTIASVLVAEGHKITAHSIGRHHREHGQG